MIRACLVFVAVAALAALVSACGDDDEEPAGLEHDVHVHLDEWSVEADPPSFPGSGTIAFGGHNHGKYPHQVTVLKTDMPVDELPIDRGRVDNEEAGELIMEFEVPAADGDEGLQVGIADLTVGKYAIFCNIPGHYLQGMVTAFEVTEAPAGTP